MMHDADLIHGEPSAKKGNLFLGNQKSAEDPNFFKANKIGAVLTLMKKSTVLNLVTPKNLKHLRVDVEDMEHVDLMKWFEKGYEFIEENL